jgi:hypothetical protein
MKTTKMVRIRFPRKLYDHVQQQLMKMENDEEARWKMAIKKRQKASDIIS